MLEVHNQHQPSPQSQVSLWPIALQRVDTQVPTLRLVLRPGVLWFLVFGVGSGVPVQEAGDLCISRAMPLT